MVKDFIHNQHARTAIGLMPNKNWVFVTVEENPILNTLGMSIQELTDFMYNLGCEYALNLDGGGSTSLYIADNLDIAPVINSIDFNPSQIRPVTDAILVRLPVYH